MAMCLKDSRCSHSAEARAQLKVVERAFGKPVFGPEFIAAGAAEIGDTTTMHRWLDTGQRERSGVAPWLGLWDRPFLAHRQEPHFQRILQRMELTPLTFAAPPNR